MVSKFQAFQSKIAHYEKQLWSNHLSDLHDLCVRVQEALDRAKRLRTHAADIKCDHDAMEKLVNRCRRRLREQSQSSKETQKMLEVDIYLKGMLDKLFTYGENIRLIMYPVNTNNNKSTTLRSPETDLS